MALTRKLNPMPPEIERALANRGLGKAYAERPDYQRNDYLGWIARAKLPATRQKRLDQMLDELERGGVYMNMNWGG
ncbi:MAG: YdeI/OmpD-associated family protein [Rhodoblastus sp.]|nr:YdeI/OmpD-associated family protein [Rhodoblastus sp.]